MLSNEFLPIRSVQLLLLFFVPLAAIALRRNRIASLVAAWAVAVWFVAFKFTAYLPAKSFPMDLSTMCYFLFVFGTVLPVRPFKVAVSQLCALCGLVYGLCVFFIPQTFAGRAVSEMDRYFTLANHALLYFGGLVTMMRVGFRKSDLIWSAALLGATIAYIEICVAKGIEEGTAVFSQIVNGSIILIAAPNFTPTWWYYVLYYLVLFSLLGGWTALTYEINRRTVPKTVARGFFAV